MSGAEECRGAVVRSLCGRDRFRLYMITGRCDGDSQRVTIADGALHPLSKPKKKSLRHLAVLAAASGEATSVLSSDSELKSYLEAFERDALENSINAADSIKSKERHRK